MRLIRLATVNMKEIREPLRNWEAELGSVRLRTLGFHPRDTLLILTVSAETQLSTVPQTNERNEVIVPEVCRELEAAIELLANGLAISQRAGRAVSSATPSVALIPESDEERAWLSARSRFALTLARSAHQFISECNALELLPKLMDRQDGVALLAEALSCEHASGRFREFIRLFERAFRRANTKLIEPLGAYLVQTPYGYSVEEVRGWIVDVRHPLTHADRRSGFLIEADIRGLIPRMEQAAYEILFNKEVWRDPSPSRLIRWMPEAINTPEGGVIRQHSTPTLRVQLMDHMGVYPVNLQATITDPPAEWWYGFSSAANDSGDDVP